VARTDAATEARPVSPYVPGAAPVPAGGAPYAPGAAPVPAGGAPTVPGAAPVPAGGAPAAPAGPGFGKAERRPGSGFRVNRRALLIGVPAAVLLAGGGVTAALVAAAQENTPDKDTGGPGPSSPSPATPTTPADEFPADDMLVQVRREGSDPEDNTTDIYRVTPGGQRTALATSGADSLPQWSHDRTSLAFMRRRGKTFQLLRVGADGGTPTVMVDRLTRESRLSWSPDDRSVAYVGWVDGKVQVLTITVGQRNPRVLTRSGELKWDPTWAPHDGNLLAMSAYRRNSKFRDVVVFKADDADEDRVYLTNWGPQERNAIDPAWSPDGTRIVYACVRSTGGSVIRVIKADGSDDQPLTEGTDTNDNPTWSADGEWISFTRRAEGSTASAIFAVRADGTGLRKVTEGQTVEVYACWS
jgi:Tol biopolymer transport system component